MLTTANLKLIRLFIALWIVFIATPAYAYIDPNAGGWLYQILLPVLIAFGAAWASLKDWIRLKISRMFKRPSLPADDDQKDISDKSDRQ